MLFKLDTFGPDCIGFAQFQVILFSHVMCKNQWCGTETFLHESELHLADFLTPDAKTGCYKFYVCVRFSVCGIVAPEP